MAVNVDRPGGFKPVRHITGAAWNGLAVMCLIPAADGAACFIGDVVEHNAVGGAAGVTVNGINCEGMPTVKHSTLTTTGQANMGVVIGFLPDPNNLTLRHRAASTNRIALVVTDPTVVYEVQEDGATTPIASGDIGCAVGIVTTAGNTMTGVSSMMLDSNTVASTSTLPFKIVALVPRPDNTISTGTTDKAKYEVIFNTGWNMPNSVGTA
jgi:hypothetical protein